MERARGVALLLAALLGPLVCRAEAQPLPVITPAQYRATLLTLLDAVREPAGTASPAAIARGLPTAWRVKAGADEFSVPTEALRRELIALARKDDAGNRLQLGALLQQWLADLDAYEAVPRDSTGDRRRLAAILARREFSAVHGPSWLDRLKQQIARLLLGLLTRIFGSSSFPVVASAVVYAVMLLAVLLTALWVYRTLAGGPQPVIAGPVPVSAKEWAVWLDEAREAAAAGRWRDAVHLAYWAGISSLESQGVWPPDRARTPREYLRMLPRTSTHRPALTAITGTFEPVWYGRRDANAETFAETVAELQKLGCHSH